METRLRSVVKAITWRFGGLLVTAAVVFIVTQRGDLALSIGLFDTLAKLLAYYTHERLWLRIRFGRPRGPEWEI